MKILPFSLLLLTAGMMQSATPVAVIEFDGYTEGVVFDRDGRAYVSLPYQGAIYQVTGSAPALWARIGAPNGHKILPDGTHLVCDGAERAVLHLDRNGKVLGKAAAASEGRALRSPNDLTLDSNGGFYFTDPGGSSVEHPVGTVHYVDRQRQTHLVAEGLAFPNGIVLRADGRTLLVSESKRNRIVSYPVSSPGKLGPMSVFAALPEKTGRQIGNEPDGLCLDTRGYLYVAHYGMGEVQVVGPDGRLRHRHPAGVLTTSNVAFGGPRMDQLFVTGALGDEKTTRGALARLDLPGVRGLDTIPAQQP